MTTIIFDWLSEEVGLSNKVIIEDAFANGYLLGKLLKKHGLQEDFSLFRDSSSLDICLSNFSRLGRTLRSCGLNFDARIACDIINKETGVVYNILHELYIYLHCTNQAERLASIQKWESLCPHANAIYQQQLRRLVPRQIDKTLKDVAGHYKTRQEQNEKQAEYRELLLTYQREEKKQAKRKEMLERSRQLRLAQAEVMARIQANVIEIPKKWLTSSKRIAPRPEKLLVSTEGIALKELEEFDLRMKARSHSQENSQVPDSATNLIDRVTHVPQSDDQPVDFVAESWKPEESEAYVRRIKERVRTEQLALQERQRRQRRVIIASLEEQRAQEEEQRSRQLAERLLQQSQLEQRLRAQLEHVKAEKAIIQANRLERQKQEAAIREAEFQAAMDRERERLRIKKEEEAGIFAVLQEVWANRKAKQRQKAYTRHYDFVSKGVVELILQFVEQVVRYRAYTGCLIPSKLFSQWKAQFVTGKPFQQVADTEEDQDTLVDLDHAEEELDEMSLLEYQDLRGEWSISQVGRMENQPLPDADMQITVSHCIDWRTENFNANSNGMPVLNFESMTTGLNPVFDWVISRLKQLVYPPPEATTKPDLPEIPIRAAILGKPLSGKSTFSQMLAESYNVEVINVHELVKDLLELFHESQEQCELDDTSQEVCKQFEVGKRMNEELQAGRELSDELIAQAVFEHIRSLPDGTSFILDGFPTNIRQAELLTLHLTVANFPENSSAVGSNQLSSKKECGLDLVILLDVPDDEIFRRAVRLSSEEPEREVRQSEINEDQSTQESQEPPVKTANSTLPLDSLHNRLEEFEDAWPQLAEFYNKSVTIVQETVADQTSADYNEGKADVITLQTYAQIDQLFQNVLENRTKGKQSIEQPNALDEGLQAIDHLEEKVHEPRKPTEGPDSEAKEPYPAPKNGPKDKDLKQLSSEDLQPNEITDAQRVREDEVTTDKSHKTANLKQTQPTTKTESKAETPKSPHSTDSQARRSAKHGSKQPKRSTSTTRRKRSSRTLSAKETEKTAIEQENVDASSLKQEQILPPKPGEEGWCYVDRLIPLDSASALIHFYEDSENSYKRNCMSIFRVLRRDRWAVLPHLHKARTSFYNYLRRPDMKQHYVTQFQESFNAVLDEMRADKETKADLHCRADDLRDQLYEILDESKLANEARIPVCLNPSSWLTNKLYLLTNYYVALMQVELARFEERASLMRDYYRMMEKQTRLSEQAELERIQNCIDPRAAEYTRLPLLQLTEDSVDVEETDSTKSKASTPSLPTGRKKLTTSSHSKSRESSSGNRPTLNTLSDYSSSLDSVISCLPPEFATRTILLNSRSNLAEIYSALTKNGPTFAAATTSGGLQEPNTNIQEPRNSARVEGRATRADRKTSRSSAKAPLPNANELFIDNAEAPKESETLFLYNVCLCALQTIQNQYHAEKKRLQSGDEVEKHPTEVVVTKQSRLSGSKRLPASRMKKQTELKPPTPVSKITEEDHAAVEVRHRIRQEHLAALEKLVSQCVFRLTLIRVQSCAILTELKQNIAETEQTMVDWIGTCTLKEHQAVDALIEFIRKAIEEEQALPEPLMLDGDRFYVQKEQMREDGTATSEIVETQSKETSRSNDLSYFSFEQLTDFLKQFQHSAPRGIIGVKSFTNILSPIIEERMHELSGPTSRENIEELTRRIILAYRLTFGPEDERVAPVTVGTKKPQSGKRQTVEDQSLTTDADAPKVFYIDWRRFLLAATHSFDIFNPEAQPNKEMLIRLCERLFELDQTSADNRGPGLLGTEVTRAQFRFAPFPWFPKNHTYYEQLHDFIFSIFTDPNKIELQNELEKWGVDLGPKKSDDTADVTSKPKEESETGDSEKDSSGQDLTHADLSLAQKIDCCLLMLSLALLSSDTSLTGIWRCLSVLSMQEVPEYPNLKTCFECPADLEARDPLIHQAVLEKLLCFGLICVEPTTVADLQELRQVADTVTSYIRRIKDALRKIFTKVQSLNATSSSDNAVRLSVLLQQPETLRLLREAEARFTLPKMPEPWPTLLRMYARQDSNSTSTVYDSGDENQSRPTNAQSLLQDI
ncbi:hypothetical protein CRM22_009288 [Opisthorchis felineus]|uniref:Uncharacterized protein n=1 Tax=Opisthorchis felineus TaxID=147828 RepID=A0A4S2L9H5_OPIFE|nr:hypothetical protein CRM22_009288 [Opisthorchis felineus]